MIVTIGWLYPAEMSTYGDRGNVLALVQRAHWRGIEPRVVRIGRHETAPADIDVFFIGGGQDLAQTAVAQSLLLDNGARIRGQLEEGAALLAICGGYQLLCHEYVTGADDRISGLGIFDAVTIAGRGRLVGNVHLSTRWGEVVGFENHSGRTFPSPGTEPLGRVLSGFGNNGEDGTEGQVAGSAIGSYLHGALLPRNPALTDWLLARGIGRREPGLVMEPLPNDLEIATHAVR